MNRKNIKDYIKQLNDFESIEYEYKVKLNKVKPQGWAKTIAAFANKGGGKLYIGVADNGTAIGILQGEVDKEQRYLVDFIKNRITPLIEFEIDYIHLDDDMIVICVETKEFKGDVVKYINKEKDNIEEVYIRKPGSTYLANFDESMRLYLRKSHEPYDARITDYNINDYTIHSLNEKYKEMNDALEDISMKQLINTRMVDDKGSLSIGGMLFIDKREEQFPLIHMRKWPGFNKGDDVVIDRKEFRGSIINQLNMALLFIKNNTKTGFVKMSNGRRDIDSYPERAVIEALCNALGHRDYTIPGTQVDIDIYQDRIVIMSPGSFLPDGNAQDYNSIDGIPSKRRNEVICDILALCKLMERSGSGFEKIREVYKAYENRFQPKVKSYEGYFSITLMDLTFNNDYENIVNKKIKEIITEDDLDEIDKKIIQIMMANPITTQNQIATSINKSKRTVQTRIKKLRVLDIIAREGSQKSGQWIVKIDITK